MEFDPRNYQVDLIQEIISKKKIIVIVDMGLGKTVCTLSVLNELMTDCFEINRVLVVAPPKVAAGTWPEEMKKWSCLKYLDYSLIWGTKLQREEALTKKSLIHIISMHNLVWLVKCLKNTKHWPYDALIIDESSCFKSYKSERFRILKPLASHFKRVILLTGTPSPNGLDDLWSQVYLLDGGERLGSCITRFRERYMYPHPKIKNKWLMKQGVEQEIYDKISDISFVLKGDGLVELPERVDNFIKIKMDDETKARYSALEKHYVLELPETDIIANNAGILANKLLQLANGAIYDDEHVYHEVHKLKLEALDEIIECNEGKNILVLYGYEHDVDRLKKYFSKYNPRVFRTLKDKDDWNNGEISLFLAHPASMSHGLNLQFGGSIIVWFSLTWNLEHYLQTNKRLYRSGQKNTTVINHLVLENSIDEEVVKRLKQKEITQEDLKNAILERRLKYLCSQV